MIETVKTSFSVSETTLKQIRLLAQQSNQTVSQVVRLLCQKILQENLTVNPSSRPTIEYAIGPCSQKIYVRLPPAMIQALGSLRAWRRLSASALLAIAVGAVLEVQNFSGEIEINIVHFLCQNEIGSCQWVTQIHFIGWLPPP